MKFILGEKVTMTQYFDAQGRAHGATVVAAGPAVVTQLKTVEKDGYTAVQVAFGQRKEKNIAKPQIGHFAKAVKASGDEKLDSNFRHSREFRVTPEELANYTLGQVIDATAFATDDTIRVSGISKGKGFQGVVKRHGFGGGRRSHGQKHSEREPGSISGGLRTGTRKGMRMAGRMGGERMTIKNLKIVQIDADKNEILISGAIPGRRGTLIEIKG